MTDELRVYHIDDPDDAPGRRVPNSVHPSLYSSLYTTIPQYVIPPVANSLYTAMQYYWYSAYQQGLASAHQQGLASAQRQQQQRLQQQLQHHQQQQQQQQRHQQQSPSQQHPDAQQQQQVLQLNQDTPQHQHQDPPQHHQDTHHHLQDLQQQPQQQQQQHEQPQHLLQQPHEPPPPSSVPLQQPPPPPPPPQSQQQQPPQGQEQQHIKKPLNPFMIYMQKQRPKIVRQGIIKESAAINQLLGQQWRKLSREEQEPYYKLAEQEKILHAQKYPGWSARDNYANQKRRKKLKLKAISMNGLDQSDKKCRARFGLSNIASWCKPCRRKKRCIYSLPHLTL